MPKDLTRRLVFDHYDTLVVRPLLMGLVVLVAPFFGVYASTIRIYGVAMLALNLVLWCLLGRGRRLPFLLPALNAAGWACLAGVTSGGASPFVLGLFVEVGLAALQLSLATLIAVTLVGMGGFAILAALADSAAGRTVALTGFACVVTTGTAFVLLVRRLNLTPDLASERLRAAHVAHGLKNQLHGVAGFAELLTADLNPEDPRRQLAAQIRSGINEMNTRLGELMAPAPAQGASTRVRPVIDRALANCQGVLDRARVTGHCEVPEDFLVSLDPRTLHDILINLIHNATEAMQPAGGAVHIAARTQPLRITVIDSGPGVQRELRERIFEAHFTTRAAGHGLGLADARSQLRRVGGDLVVDDAPGGGAAFTLIFERLSRQQTA